MDSVMNKNGANSKSHGALLNKEWAVGADHALFSAGGTWYQQLKRFPGAFFDPNGYVLFETEEEYIGNPYLQIGKTVNIADGIASLPNYVRADTLIVDDEDTEDIDGYESGSIYPYDMVDEVDIRVDPFSVFQWIRKLERKDLVIDPEFQRKLVWKWEQKSQYIESVLLNIPLPPLYVNQRKDGKLIIVDGLQRTTTLADFLMDQFALAHLRVLTKLNGFKFSELPSELQTKIEDSQLLVYIIKPSVPINMVYDIFHRINTGGTQLTRQEIRNCFYIGQATQFLKELAESDVFRLAIGNGISPKRMKDREAVLRYLAFQLLDYEKEYKNDMDAFLGTAMERMNRMPSQELDLLKKQFERVMLATYEFFGENNFRLPTESTKGRINIALMESVCNFFASHKNEYLYAHKEQIISNYQCHLLTNSQFINAIRFSTSDTRRVLTRFRLALEILGES